MLTYIIPILFALTQLGDWYTTRTILKQPGGEELNPIMSWLFKTFNVDFVLFVKTLALTTAVYFVCAYSIPIALILTVYYVWVVAHNSQYIK